MIKFKKNPPIFIGGCNILGYSVSFFDLFESFALGYLVSHNDIILGDLFFEFFGMLSLVRIYHYFFDLKVGCIYSHIFYRREHKSKRERHGNGNKQTACTKEKRQFKNNKHNCSEKCHNITLDSDYCEDQRVL